MCNTQLWQLADWIAALQQKKSQVELGLISDIEHLVDTTEMS